MGAYKQLHDYYFSLAKASARPVAERGMEDVYRLRAQRVDQYWQSIAQLINIGRTIYNALLDTQKEQQQLAKLNELYSKYAKLLGEPK